MNKQSSAKSPLMALEDRDGLIWLDGKLEDWRLARLHVLSHGLHYAGAAWEGLRTYKGQILKLEEHTARLFKSASTMRMTIPYSQEDINSACKETVLAQKINNGYIRPIVWRGGETLSVEGRQTSIHAAIGAWEVPSFYAGDVKDTGIRMIISERRRAPPNCGPWDCKTSGQYAPYVLAKQEAEEQEYNDALLLDWRGYIAEATSANIFLVIEGSLHTPTPDCFLNGITRQTVIKLAQARSIPVIERHIRPQDLKKANEVFITGTAVELTPVQEIGKHSFNVGPITRQLMSDYSQQTVKIDYTPS